MDDIEKAGGPRRYIADQLQKKPSADTPRLKELSEADTLDSQLYTSLLPKLRQYCIWAYFCDGLPTVPVDFCPVLTHIV